MRVLIDACVLYPTVLREIVLGVAGQGLFTPLWSDRILEEWAHAAARLGPVGADVARGEMALLRAAWPGAAVDADAIARAARDFDVSLPDPNDAHVLAAAIAGRADLILTFNLRDFPRGPLSHHGLHAEHPDRFLPGLFRDHAEQVTAVVEAVRAKAARLSDADQPLRPLLRRANLPRLAKALAARA
jgi:predicted nucleic acid-binding protein